jgi:hypothetical protein
MGCGAWRCGVCGACGAGPASDGCAASCVRGGQHQACDGGSTTCRRVTWRPQSSTTTQPSHTHTRTHTTMGTHTHTCVKCWRRSSATTQPSPTHIHTPHWTRTHTRHTDKHTHTPAAPWCHRAPADAASSRAGAAARARRRPTCGRGDALVVRVWCRGVLAACAGVVARVGRDSAVLSGRTTAACCGTQPGRRTRRVARAPRGA